MRGEASGPEALIRPHAHVPSPGPRPSTGARGILELQRLIGNQAVQRLATRNVLQTKSKVGPAGNQSDPEADVVAGSFVPMTQMHPAVQRYVIVEEGDHKKSWKGERGPLRVSDDGQMAVKHLEGSPKNTEEYQAFYATSAILRSSQAALAKVGSALFIQPTSASMQGRAPGDKTATMETLYKAAVQNRDLERTGRGGFLFVACTLNFENLLGILRSTPADPTLLQRRRELVTKMEGSLDHQNKRIETGPNLSSAMSTAREISTGAKRRPAYDKLEESVRKQLSEQYGVNEYALPDVGEGWGIQQGGAGGKASAGLHFAPVIAASGGDRVTLENDVSQSEGQQRKNTAPIGPMWYFRMFGSLKKTKKGVEDQTFWGEAKKYDTEEFGDKPFVAAIGSEEQIPLHDVSALEDMLATYRLLRGERHPSTLQAATNLARTLRELGKKDEAGELEDEFGFR